MYPDFLVNLMIVNYKNVYDDFNPRYAEHKQQMNQLKF